MLEMSFDKGHNYMPRLAKRSSLLIPMSQIVRIVEGFFLHVTHKNSIQ